MKLADCLISACRHCNFYSAEGRRGGHCQQLGVSVRGNWKACSLAAPPFLPKWKSLEEIMVGQQRSLESQPTLPSEITLVNALPEVASAEGNENWYALPPFPQELNSIA
jgi:hypothetical protein